ncbi:zinc dependent phospholipase C family protein [Mucilaginibacter sp.]|uniref:zinc dependent phospholipase C family protein n=1 Tax=Mucilaginibacter sp. TaxID=1882438 RepID=UPI002841C69B|nr:zinc dependent phospholipase C family protein [Mucilaginibacter sp.]MDR3695112.1 zinc dependent phospholipase C family protein [Mucilaginibacter sp.]
MPTLKIPHRYIIILVLLVSFIPKPAKAYSVLTHEALIDASWKKSILPLLKQKYPAAADSDLVKAHAYTYGGALIADMGYFPFGSVYFTNLAHYVRSGDFVENLLSESQNLNEYAFALGALCHYMADKYGHSLATNHVVPIVYPEMREKFGPVVTYDDDHVSHSRVEIAFDVLETARGNYASQNYHDFIGFEVAKPVLERAFLKTYGQDINAVFGNLDLAISTFRWSVKSLLPTVTRTAWLLKKNDIKKSNPSANEKTFHYRMKRKAYYKEFGSSRQKPKFKERILAFVIRIMPKIGPFKALRFKPVGPEGEKLFVRSFDTVIVHYDDELNRLHNHAIDLKDMDYDTGKPTMPGEYGLADKTYVELLDKLQDNKFIEMTKSLQQNLLNFYNNADTTQFAQKYSADWKKTSLALQELKAATPVQIDSLKDAKGIYYKMNEPAVQPVNVNDGKIKSKPIPASEQPKVN